MAEKKSSIKRALVIALVVCLLIVVFQNTESVRTQILFVSMEMPRFVLLGIMLLIGFATGFLMRKKSD